MTVMAQTIGQTQSVTVTFGALLRNENLECKTGRYYRQFQGTSGQLLIEDKVQQQSNERPVSSGNERPPFD